MFYQIIATKDFIDVMKDIPLKYISIFCNSFISIRKLSDENSLNTEEYNFLSDLLEQMKNHEIE